MAILKHHRNSLINLLNIVLAPPGHVRLVGGGQKLTQIKLRKFKLLYLIYNSRLNVWVIL